MADKNLNMPSGMGGLVRFKEGYRSKFNIKPVHVIGFVVFLVVFRILLGVFLTK